MSEATETTLVTGDTPRGTSPLTIGLAVAGAIVAATLLWFFVAAPLLLGDDDAATDDVAPATAAAADGPNVATEPTTEQPLDAVVDDVEPLPVVTYEVFLERDPFDPVVPEPTSASGGTTTTNTDGGTTTGGTTTGGTSDGSGDTDGDTDGDDDADGTADDGSDGDDEVPDPGVGLSLVQIGRDEAGLFAIVQLDSTLYEVREGDTFAEHYVVESISESVVVIRYGDRVFPPFEEGDRVLK